MSAEDPQARLARVWGVLKPRDLDRAWEAVYLRRAGLHRPHEALVSQLTGRQARDALAVLLGMPDPARRWALEGIAIACPGDTADYARSLKENPLGVWGEKVQGP